MSPSDMSAFERLDLDPSKVDELTTLYRRWRLLWLRPRDADGVASGVDALRRVARAVADDGADEFSVENAGDAARDPAQDALAPSAVFGSLARCADAATANTARLPAHFYVSTVLGGDAAARVLAEAPISEPSFLPRDAAHGTPAWLFVGSNSPSDSAAAPSRKRKTAANSDAAPASDPPRGSRSALAGRTEHTDHVTCSGTWHHQLSGRKTWYLRPFDRASAWRGDPPPDVGTARRQAWLEFSSSGEDDRGPRRRLVIETQEGDVLAVDTGAWWHETALPSSPSMSASLAREFFLAEEHGGKAGAEAAARRAEAFTNVDGLYAKRFVAAGEIVCTQEDFEDGGPNVGRSGNPNCAVAEIDDEDEDEEGGGTMVLVALRDVAAGEFLTVEPSDEDDDEEDDEDEEDEEE